MKKIMDYAKKIKFQLIIIIAALLALIASVFLDNYVLNNIIPVIQHPYLTMFFNLITNFTILFIVLIVLTSYFMYIEKKREWILPMWSSFILTTIIVIALKLLVARERPVQATELFFSYAFPSLHTAVCFAVIPILDVKFPKLKIFWIILGVLVGISRIYLKVHYVSDVIAGALIGYAVGLAFFYLNQKYLYRIKW